MKHPIRAYFATTVDHNDHEVLGSLVNPDMRAEAYFGGPPAFQAAILDQYKLYVEMADRVSGRRALANTFFLTINTAVFTLIGVLWNRRPEAATWVLVFPLSMLVTQCLAWFWTLRSYRQLNSAKYVVVGAIETCLPLSPYRRAEWTALGEGRDPSRYWPITHLESLVPLLFAVTYIGAFVASFLA